MATLATPAVVLHAFDYLETSRIYRLLTREAGVQSVLARGARRPRSRFGTAVDLFAEGEAQLSIRSTRELQTLTAFDVTRARPQLGASLERFTAAAALAELAMRFARDDANPTFYDAVILALDAVTAAADTPGAARDAALGGAWHLVAELGFAPTIDVCSICRAPISRTSRAPFSHPAGGVVCAMCSATHAGTRVLPASARDAIRVWTGGRAFSLLSVGEGRAHQRLLREFVAEHLSDGRTLRAFDVWERGYDAEQPSNPAPVQSSDGTTEQPRGDSAQPSSRVTEQAADWVDGERV